MVCICRLVQFFFPILEIILLESWKLKLATLETDAILAKELLH